MYGKTGECVSAPLAEDLLPDTAAIFRFMLTVPVEGIRGGRPVALGVGKRAESPVTLASEQTCTHVGRMR